MNRLRSFREEVDERTRVLVLGTMPGAVSLERGEYYAHKQNRFWRVIEEIAGVPSDAPYAERVSRLLAARIGLWDTLQECDRKGSLDSMIRDAEPNDFEGLLRQYSTVAVIALNGRKAAEVFHRRILPTLSGPIAARLIILELPSTSPANARGGFAGLLEKWKVLGRWIDPAG